MQGIAGGRKLGAFVLDHLFVQLAPDGGIAVGAQLLFVGGEQDRMPRRRAAEDLAVLHREVLRGPVRAAQREGADAGLRRLLEARHVLLPRVGIAHRLAEIVVDDGAARRFGEAAPSSRLSTPGRGRRRTG